MELQCFSKITGFNRGSLSLEENEEGPDDKRNGQSRKEWLSREEIESGHGLLLR
jgi:hypothetical protein